MEIWGVDAILLQECITEALVNLMKDREYQQQMKQNVLLLQGITRIILGLDGHFIGLRGDVNVL